MKYSLCLRRAMLLAVMGASLHGVAAQAQEEAQDSDASAPVVGTRPAMNMLTPQSSPSSETTSEGTWKPKGRRWAEHFTTRLAYIRSRAARPTRPR